MKGTSWTKTTTCLDCGFTHTTPMMSWGDCDFEDEEVHSDRCVFCQHALDLGIPIKKYLLHKLKPILEKKETLKHEKH